MISSAVTTSAVLYLDWPEQGSIPFVWFERAVKFFREHGLAPILFTANDCEVFLLDDCYLLAERGQTVKFWGDTIQGRNDDLIVALRNGAIVDLGLDSPRTGATRRDEWRADVSVFSTFARVYVGADETLLSDCGKLLRRAYSMAEGIFEPRYGIAYKMRLSEAPASYATGRHLTSVSEALWMIQHRDEWERRTKTPDELWSEELMGQRRHLTGLFRGAYPANILSEAHVRSAALLSRGIGKLTELDNSLWLWELTDSEIPEAQRMLESRGVLVSQAASN
jgi:hypothetical protein